LSQIERLFGLHLSENGVTGLPEMMSLYQCFMRFRALVCFAAGVLLTSCAVGPNYKRPDAESLTPHDWRWKLAEPKDALPKGSWWEVFGDPVLNQLETNAVAKNQDLQAAVARVDEARATARVSRSQFFPEITLDPAFIRQRTSANAPNPVPFKVPSTQLDTYTVPFDLSYEVDLWGRIRRLFESARAQAQASIADYQNVQLTLTSDVAVNYFLIRSLDMELDTLRRTIQEREKSVQILNQRFSVGTIAEIDLVNEKTDLATAKADLADTTRLRAETLDALALLCGVPATSFQLSNGKLPATLPSIPLILPSALLERRPDIATAERNLASKNAQIGVSRAAYFPALQLVGQAGYLSADAETLFTAGSRIWSIGPNVSLPLFTAGRTTAEVHQAEAAYAEGLANYRGTVLTAFKEVEDSMAQIALRQEQHDAQADAVIYAKRATELAKIRYDAGSANYLEYIDADRTELQQERLEVQIEGQQFVATVRLIKALGGGWTAEPGS
jgi:multidrug efflux system outer membrane protein